MAQLRRLLFVLLPTIVIVAALFSAPTLVFGDRGLPRLRTLQQRLEEIEEQNAELRRDNERLRRRISALRDDPDQIEAIARDELGLVKPDELIFHF